MGSKRLGDFWQQNINSSTKGNSKVGWNYSKIISPQKPSETPEYALQKNYSSSSLIGGAGGQLQQSHHHHKDDASSYKNGFYSHANSAFSPVGSFQRPAHQKPHTNYLPKSYQPPIAQVPVTKSSSNSSLILPSVNFNNLALAHLTKSSSSSCIYAKSLNQPNHLRKNNDIFSTYKGILPDYDISDASKMLSSNTDLLKKPQSAFRSVQPRPKPESVKETAIVNLEDNIGQSIADIYKVGSMYGRKQQQQAIRPMGWTQIAKEPAVSVFAPTSSLNPSEPQPMMTNASIYPGAYVQQQQPQYYPRMYQPPVEQFVYGVPTYEPTSGYYYTQAYIDPLANIQNEFNTIKPGLFEVEEQKLQAPALVQKTLQRQDAVRSSNLNPEAKNFTPLAKSATMKYFSRNPPKAQQHEASSAGNNYKTTADIDEMMSYQQDLLKAIEPYFNEVVPSPSKSDSSTLTNTTPVALPSASAVAKKDFDMFYDESDLDTDDEADADDESEDAVPVVVVPKKGKRKLEEKVETVEEVHSRCN